MTTTEHAAEPCRIDPMDRAAAFVTIMVVTLGAIAAACVAFGAPLVAPVPFALIALAIGGYVHEGRSEIPARHYADLRRAAFADPATARETMEAINANDGRMTTASFNRIVASHDRRADERERSEALTAITADAARAENPEKASSR